MESARERAASKDGDGSYRESPHVCGPSLDEMLSFANGYVPEKLRDDFAAKLEEKYRSE